MDEGHLLIDVNGLGYEVEVTQATRSALSVGQNIVLYTHFSVREDAQALYGFAGRGERDLFRALIRISGIGPKLALGLLSGMGTAEFAQSIMGGNVAALIKLPGVGKKTAERLVVELKDKVSQWIDGSIMVSTRNKPSSSYQDEAEKALVALGYRPQEASRLIASVIESNMSTEDIIKAALRNGIKQSL